METLKCAAAVLGFAVMAVRVGLCVAVLLAAALRRVE